MRELTDLTAALAVALFATGAASAATAPAAAPTATAAAAKPAGPSDKAQILALEKGFVAAFNKKDVAKIMSYYAKKDLFVFDVVPPREYVGWDAYKKDWEGLLEAFPGPLSVTMSELSVTVVGSIAYGHGIQDANFTLKDGTKVETVVRVTDVYRKTAGRWQIVQEHVSVPVDLTTMKADPLSKP
jgi:ketosteroid isomerase-like protein